MSTTKLTAIAAMMLIIVTGCSQNKTETQSQATPQTSTTTETAPVTEAVDTVEAMANSTETDMGSTDGSSAGESPIETSTDKTMTEPETATKKLVPVPASLQFAVSDPDGNMIQSQNWFTGGPVVLNFWGTWCPPCRREVPALVEINNEFAPKGVKMVSLSYNDSPEQVKQFVAANGMNWEQVLVDQDVVASFGIQGFPTTIFYTADGKELGRMVGGRSHADFHNAFSMLVKN